jgi:serine/threonine protein kinase
MSEPVPCERTETVGRYALQGEIASGGMAVVYFGKLLGPVGFCRPVAIKRLHKQLARDPGVRDMFIDEARLASRIRHPNVVPTLDVVDEHSELLLVMEYVHGESLQLLLRAMRQRNERVPLRIALAIMTGMLHGLHAAHEACSEAGEPLHIVHRDVSPQNVLCGTDGVPRVLDFGVARAAVRLENTREGIVKGKLAYMAPEQLGGAVVDRRADVYSAAVILWEMLAGKRLFVREDGASVLVDKLLRGTIEPPSTHTPSVPKLLDAITLHGLTRNPEQRFATAREMALAIERFGELARPSEIGEWVEALAAESLAIRKGRLKELEMTSSTYRLGPPGSTPEPAPLKPALDELIDITVEEDTGGTDEASFPRRLVGGSGGSSSSMPSPQAVSISPGRAISGVEFTRRAAFHRRPLLVFGAYALLGAALTLTALTSHRARPEGDGPSSPRVTKTEKAAGAMSAPAPVCQRRSPGVPGGRFTMGSDGTLPLEGPARAATPSTDCVDVDAAMK